MWFLVLLLQSWWISQFSWFCLHLGCPQTKCPLIQVSKWRPFIFGMFSRHGVLSPSKWQLTKPKPGAFDVETAAGCSSPFSYRKSQVLTHSHIIHPVIGEMYPEAPGSHIKLLYDILTGKSSILGLKTENIIYPPKGHLHGKNYDKLWTLSCSFNLQVIRQSSHWQTMINYWISGTNTYFVTCA